MTKEVRHVKVHKKGHVVDYIQTKIGFKAEKVLKVDEIT